VFAVVVSSCLTANLAAQDSPGRVNPYPCHVVVKSTLRGVFEKAHSRSPTLQRQCHDLLVARAVVVLEWGTRNDSLVRARTKMELTGDGVVVAYIFVPPVSEAMQLVAHELEHVIELAQGVDYVAESRRPGSGVWETHAGYETRRAIDTERQVTSELHDKSRDRR
jgi:hypothetical protein